MLNEALRLIRVYHDLSQTELAQILSVSNSHLSEIESGKKQPSLDLLKKYSDHFDIPVSSMLFFSEGLEAGESNMVAKLRKGAAKKFISLLQWMDAKNDSRKITA